MPRSSARPAAPKSIGAETVAARRTIERASSPRSPSHLRSALPPGNADGVNRRREFSQDPVHFLAVAGVIRPRLAIRLAGAAAPVRHRQPPAARERLRGERARIVAVGTALEAVE